MHQTTRSILTLLVAMFLLAGCQMLEADATPADSGEETSIKLPTPTEGPSQSSIPVAQATLGSPAETGGEVLLPQPTDDPRAGVAFLPTPTATPGPGGLIVTALSVNVRSGPGTAYEIIDVVEVDEEFDLVGRTEAGDWWQACCFDGEMGWFFDELVDVADPDAIPVVTDIPPVPLPTPTVEGEANEPELPEETASEEGDVIEPVVPVATATAEGETSEPVVPEETATLEALLPEPTPETQAEPEALATPEQQAEPEQQDETGDVQTEPEQAADTSEAVDTANP